MAQEKLSFADPFADALTAVASRAGAADRGEITLAADLACLHDSGLLMQVVCDCLPDGNVLAGATMLRRIGRASLSVGRIVEGHVNALRLIQLYGTSVQRQQAMVAARGPAKDHGPTVFGVWGADGKPPVRVADMDTATATLSGAKQFCSGIGLVSRAVIPVTTCDGVQLFLADVDEAARGDVSGWTVSGMRATASGRYDLTGVGAQTLGDPDDYLREPHFEGGIWRYCAVQCGGLEALAEQACQHIIARGQSEDPHQRARFARLVAHAHTARLWVDASCKRVEQGWQATGVPQVLLAREAVEQACQAGIALTERIMGTAAFNAESDADRIRRDLGFFLRQANLDSKLDKAAEALLAPGTALMSEAFS
ncbi:MAG: acyl-CoA dehydrogenase family protein [Pseudotabrizicola sp.]|uniref:acyl-CoA dehydrogenase family protein n=1 Tax=Pseudotabrizicola sp. TaxID=2939647 RepID=UPI002720DD9A|nr:acyl-CoA dehydrogenase family protein [Pseudotabrizicola sp.]MDO9639904.1 acyl-CoA dehydrogenase family protein [Pseudotabrizicola sp.]